MSKAKKFFEAVLNEASEKIHKTRLMELFHGVGYKSSWIYPFLTERIFVQDGDSFVVDYVKLRNRLAKCRVQAHYTGRVARHDLGTKQPKEITLSDGRRAVLTTVQAYVIKGNGS